MILQEGEPTVCEGQEVFPRIHEKFAFLGSGIIAGVWMERLLATGVVEPQQIMACDVRPERLQELAQKLGVQTDANNRDGAGFARVVVLAPPPNAAVPVLREIRSSLGPKHLVISLAAGVPLTKLEQESGEAAVVRVMPNTPALVGDGMNLAAFGRRVSEADRRLMRDLLDVLGKWFEVPDEQMDAWCALCAVGPTYIFPTIEALASAAGSHGLDAEKALAATAQVVAGAAHLVLESGRSPAELKQMISLRTLPEEEARKLFTAAYEEAFTKLEALERRLAA
jgi:pyrroline-5-carboxylate reductase